MFLHWEEIPATTARDGQAACLSPELTCGVLAVLAM